MYIYIYIVHLYIIYEINPYPSSLTSAVASH